MQVKVLWIDRFAVLGSLLVEGKDRSPRRGRPPNLARRRTIVRAALELFADQGYQGAAMRAVAERAGIGAALVYRYYPSKRELLAAVIAYVNEEADALHVRYSRAAQEQPTLRGFLHVVGTALLDHLALLHPWYALRVQQLPLNEQQRRAILYVPERFFQAIARALAARGEFADPYVTARTFCGAIIYQQMLQLRLGLETETPALRKIFLDQLIDLIAQGREAA